MRAADNDLLTCVGPGTPMGILMRQYWLPALKSTELTAGAGPLRLRILGEDFIAFRSPSGEVGVVEHRCAHRCASLFFGRNEPGGIRCVYHGWKFAADGRCIEMPSEPAGAARAHNVRIRALATRECHGAVWVYMGSRTPPPPFPELDLDRIPPGEQTVSFVFRECNWLQALEGDIDTCHVGFLHLGGFGPERFEPGSIDYYRQAPQNLAPRYEVIETPYGTMYSAFRPAGDAQTYHRVGQFAYPFWTSAPSDPMGTIRLRAWLPVDDAHSMLIVFSGPRPAPQTLDRHGESLPGASVELEFLPNTADWYGRWRLRQNRDNDYMISRDFQQHGNFTGIQGIPLQDQAITESMGAIVDRRYEHLGSSDQMIIKTRQCLLRRARTLAETGEAPPGVDDPGIFRGVRAGFLLLANEEDWLARVNAYRQEWHGSVTPLTRRQETPSPVRSR